MAAKKLTGELRASLADPAAIDAAPFRILKQLSLVLGSEEPDAVKTELVLRALDQRSAFGELQSILDTLARHTGHFPYVDPSNLSGPDLLAYEFHRPLDLDDQTVFHRVQADVYRILLAGENVILSAPTSFGKSRIIDAMIALRRYDNIAVIVPTLALIDETRRRLSAFRDPYKVITHLSQKPGERNLFVLTAERAVAFEGLPRIDFFVIDEFYKLGLNEDGDRMVALNSAFYRLRKGGGQFYLLGPNIDRIPAEAAGELNARWIRTDFATVVTEQTEVSKAGPDEEALVRLCADLDEPTIIYCSSPNQVNKVASLLCSNTLRLESEALRPAADWVGEVFHPEWVLCRGLTRGIGIHHGRLPRSLAQYVVRMFNEEKLRFLVCTSTLIEGVNTKAKNVVIYDNKIARRKIDFFTFNNIKGRSGRMFQHFVGHVYIFASPPQAQLPFVDVPFLTQDASVPESLLVQLDHDDLKPEARERIRPILEQTVLPMEVIRQNNGVDPQSQVDMALELGALPAQRAATFAWRGFPEYVALKATCELFWKHFVTSQMRRGIASASQLTFLASRLQKKKPVCRRIAEALSGAYAADSVDEAVERVLQFDRNWASFLFPRLLMATTRIQEHVFRKRGLAIGDYSVYAAKLESLFYPPVVGALDEYGIPPSICVELLPLLGTEDELDVAVQRLRVADLSGVRLTTFERELVEDALGAM